MCTKNVGVASQRAYSLGQSCMIGSSAHGWTLTSPDWCSSLYYTFRTLPCQRCQWQSSWLLQTHTYIGQPGHPTRCKHGARLGAPNTHSGLWLFTTYCTPCINYTHTAHILHSLNVLVHLLPPSSLSQVGRQGHTPLWVQFGGLTQ